MSSKKKIEFKPGRKIRVYKRIKILGRTFKIRSRVDEKDPDEAWNLLYRQFKGYELSKEEMAAVMSSERTDKVLN